MAAGSGYNSAVQRLRNDYCRMKRDPVPYIVAEPLQNNILEWHYVVFGPENTPYEGGVYHGKLIFPREFPFKPPSIYMLTPNGRFACGQRLCLSISDFHPDTWNPAWSVSTILTGLLSFMLETTATLGSLETTDAQKREFARQSISQNMRDPQFRSLFPSIVAQLEAKKASATQSCVTSRSNSESSSNVAETDTNRGAAHSLVSNLVILACVAAFAFVVRYILSNLS